jgi:hypothetical protein
MILELSGTNRVVGKTEQLKFYAAEKLTESFRGVLEEQGLSLSEGLSRLMCLLVDAPEEMRPVLLRQAPGDAAVALARFTIRNRNRKRGNPGNPKIDATLVGQDEQPIGAEPDSTPSAGKSRGRAKKS